MLTLRQDELLFFAAAAKSLAPIVVPASTPPNAAQDEMDTVSRSLEVVTELMLMELLKEVTEGFKASFELLKEKHKQEYRAFTLTPTGVRMFGQGLKGRAN